MVARNAQRADKITTKSYENNDEKVYALLSLTEGETITPIQFLITDSTHHFFRGSLAFHCKLNADSLSPVIHYLQEDITMLIQTFHWTR